MCQEAKMPQGRANELGAQGFTTPPSHDARSALLDPALGQAGVTLSWSRFFPADPPLNQPGCSSRFLFPTPSYQLSLPL